MFWMTHENVDIYVPKMKVRDSYKIAIFDLDGTLIARKNGMFAYRPDSDPYNWVFLGNIKEKLKKLRKQK